MNMHQEIEALVMAIHRRNGGTMERLDFGLRLLARELRLDSLDLAEIMAGLERRHGRTPFEGGKTPSTWEDVAQLMSGAGENGSAN